MRSTRRLAMLAIALVFLPHSAVAAQADDRKGFFDDFNKFAGQRWYVSDGWANGDWQACSWSRHNVSIKNGRLLLRLTPTKSRRRTMECGEVQSRAMLGYGTYETRMKAGRGSGIISALFTYSGPPHTRIHDELDFEVMGRNTRQVHTNYFTSGKGEHGKVIDLPVDNADHYVTYAVEWLPGGIRWFVNGKLVRTDKGAGRPTTPGKLFMSLWNVAPSKYDWAGPSDRKALPVSAEFDWVAYTPPSRRCLFAQSITC